MTASPAPSLEWIAAGVGLLFLVSLLSVVGYDAIAGDAREQPVIEIRTRTIERAGDAYVVTFEALNRGGGTAAALEIEGQLMRGATTVETSSATIDYVAGRGTSEGGLFFSQDPRHFTLKVRPLGYQAP